MKPQADDSVGGLHMQLAGLFNEVFGERYRVFMHGGFSEPLYLPATPERAFAEIRYTRDHLASVLHEAAHWCIAGARRRGLTDYGYWYQAPPRSPDQRAAFFSMEQRNQALEKLFAAALGLTFEVSHDDPGLPPRDLKAFEERVEARARYLQARLQLRTGSSEKSTLPRARMFLQALTKADLAGHLRSDLASHEAPRE